MNTRIESALEDSKNPHTRKMLRVESVHNREIKRARGCEIRHVNDKHTVNQQLQRKRSPDKSFTVLCWVFALFMALAIAPTVMSAEEGDDGGGYVLPGPAKPKGYSLYRMAKATAFFNTGDHSLETYPDTPFQILLKCD
jgi:hypothetical protein